MANKLVTEALRRLNYDKSIRDLPTFWRKIGRADLANIEWPNQLNASGVFSTILYEARRVIARRIAEAEPKKTIKLDDGTEVEVVKKGPKKRTPLTAFLFRDARGQMRQYTLSPTKGWRRSQVDVFDLEEWKKQGVYLLRRFPPGPAFRADYVREKRLAANRRAS